MRLARVQNDTGSTRRREAALSIPEIHSLSFSSLHGTALHEWHENVYQSQPEEASVSSSVRLVWESYAHGDEGGKSPQKFRPSGARQICLRPGLMVSSNQLGLVASDAWSVLLPRKTHSHTWKGSFQHFLFRDLSR